MSCEVFRVFFQLNSLPPIWPGGRDGPDQKARPQGGVPHHNWFPQELAQASRGLAGAQKHHLQDAQQEVRRERHLDVNSPPIRTFLNQGDGDQHVQIPAHHEKDLQGFGKEDLVHHSQGAQGRAEAAVLLLNSAKYNIS